MKPIIIGVIVIAIAIGVGAFAMMSELNTNSDANSEGTVTFVNESDQFFEETISPEGNDYSILLTETVGVEVDP